MGGWDFWIDRGGTFTDIVARDPDGGLRRAKLLSENPELYEDAALHGIRGFLGLGPGERIPAERVASVKMGTTVATNALLERRGEPVVLVTTQGLGEQLRLAYQNRPRLFDRQIVLPEMLYGRVIEARERVRADGTVEVPLDEAALAPELAEARAAGFAACAIVFVHGYRHQDHEARAAALAEAAGFGQVSVSHRVSPLMKMVSRGDTTVVDAYLTPILRRYIDRVAAAFDGDMGGKLLFMQSSGGLTGAGSFQGKDAILSGPAGGVVGAVRTSEIAGEGRIVGFDMGGTSTDVCHFAGAYERVFRTEIAGVRITAPMMNIHTVAAGGGSILSYDGARMRVGPESAGANPGPACYGRGGPLAVTDANVVTGRLRPEFFPAIFGPEGRPAARRRGGAGGVRAAGGGDRAGARGGGGGVPPHRRREHGERHQEDQRAARLRRVGLLPDGVRRGGGAACLRDRRHARAWRPASFIRWRRSCRPTAWGSRTSGPRAPRRSRWRWTRRGGWRRRRCSTRSGRTRRWRWWRRGWRRGTCGSLRWSI